MLKIRVEQMTLSDLDEVLTIERASFTSPWSKKAFLHELLDNDIAITLVAKPAHKNMQNSEKDISQTIKSQGLDIVLGYACLWLIYDEVHITNLATHPGFRRMGIGNQLLDYIFQLCREKKIIKLTLEVRASNQPAIALYEKFGLRTVTRRKGYYSDTREDALVMGVDL